MKRYKSKDSRNRWVCCIDVAFDASRQQWRWEIHHNELDDPRNLVMQGFCDEEATAIAICEEQAERHVERIHRNNTGHIHHWFGLTYASYLTLPRSLMQAMPGPWQLRFVELMEEFEGTFDYLGSDHSYSVQLRQQVDTVGGEDVYEDLDDPLANYRYPPDLTPYRVEPGVDVRPVEVGD